MNEEEIQRTYYPNGQIEWEGSFKNGIPHGLNRRWHENGVLASEIYLKEGVPDGIGKQWDKTGKLILTYEIKNGTGIQKSWSEEQGIGGEISLVKGTFTGRQRTYFRDKTILGDTYWIKNKQVSKKRYIEECKKDASLPHYDDIEVEKKSPAAKKPPLPNNDDICRGILSLGKAKEAKEWFKSGKCFLGEGKDEQGSKDLIESLYKAGVVKVWVFDINIDESGQQYSGRIIVEMPQKPGKRNKIFSICDEIAENLGFDPEEDCGQRYRLLMLD